MGDVEVRPVQTYVVGNTVLHVGYLGGRVRDFQPGSEFRSSDLSDACEPGELERLLASGALRYPSEVLSAEAVSAQLDRVRELEAEVATLRAAQAAGAGGQRTEDLLEQTEAQIEQAKATAVSTKVRHNP